MDVAFKKTHYNRALKELSDEGKISIEGAGSRGGLNEDTLITFDECKRGTKQITLFGN